MQLKTILKTAATAALAIALTANATNYEDPPAGYQQHHGDTNVNQINQVNNSVRNNTHMMTGGAQTMTGGAQTLTGGNQTLDGGSHTLTGGDNTGTFTNNPVTTNTTGPSTSNANGTNTATNGGNTLGTSYSNKSRFFMPTPPGTLIGNVQGECMGNQGFAIGAYLGSISFLNPKFNQECAEFVAKMKELNQGHEKEMLTKAQVHEMTMQAVVHAFGDKGTPLEQAAWTIRISEYEFEIHNAFVLAARAEQKVIQQNPSGRYTPTAVIRAHFLDQDLKTPEPVAAPAPAVVPAQAPAP